MEGGLQVPWEGQGGSLRCSTWLIFVRLRTGGVAVSPVLGVGGPEGVTGAVTCFKRARATSSFLLVPSFCLVFSAACWAFEVFLADLSDFLLSFLADCLVCLDVGGGEVAGGTGAARGSASLGSGATPAGTCGESSAAVWSAKVSMASTRMEPP